jgi:precorrin-2 dehydrogenase / sirohydrochlorin ferrochelatase
MIPIHLDPRITRIGLVGNGVLALRRHQWLKGLDCQPEVWSPEPSAAFEAAVGPGLLRHMPSQGELAGLSALWIADLAPEQAGQLAELARVSGILVNVEDDLPFCDFHTPALVRRGKLLVSIGTSGASPAAASFVRRLIEAALPAAWADILAGLASQRQDLRARGLKPGDVIAAARSRLAAAETAIQIAPCGKAQCCLMQAAIGDGPTIK